MSYTSKVKIGISPTNNTGYNYIYRKNQNVGFININTDFDVPFDGGDKPIPVPYDEENAGKYLALLNYSNYQNSDKTVILLPPTGLSPMSISRKQTYDLFRREVIAKETEKPDGTVEVEVQDVLTPLELIGEGLPTFNFRDYKVSNGRTYQYIFYPNVGGDKIIRESIVDTTKWDSWSITELHPTDSTGKNFFASKNDVWLFNFNVETGEQNQNFTRQENITLGQYPRYSEGRQNYISGTVSCLLGSQMISVKYIQEKGSKEDFGSYVEYRMFNTKPSSNEKVDMLKEWRKVIKSKNPKILKDRKGQIFVVTLTQASNKPYDNIKNQPDVINFSWTEIMSIDDIYVVNSD